MFCIIVVLLTSCSVLFDWSRLNLFIMVLFLLYWGEQHPPGLEFKIYVASFAADRQTPRLSVPSALTGCCGSTAHTAVCCDWPSPAAWTQAGWAGPSVHSQTSHCWRQRCWQLGSSLLDVGEAWGRKAAKLQRVHQGESRAWCWVTLGWAERKYVIIETAKNMRLDSLGMHQWMKFKHFQKQMMIIYSDGMLLLL